MFKTIRAVGPYMKFEFLQNPYKARASTSHHPGETCKNSNIDDINSRIIFLLNKLGCMNQLITSAICLCFPSQSQEKERRHFWEGATQQPFKALHG